MLGVIVNHERIIVFVGFFFVEGGVERKGRTRGSMGSCKYYNFEVAAACTNDPLARLWTGTNRTQRLSPSTAIPGKVMEPAAVIAASW